MVDLISFSNLFFISGFSFKNAGSLGDSQPTDSISEAPITKVFCLGPANSSVSASIRDSGVLQADSRARPSSVKCTPAASRIKSLRPRCVSSALICWLTAGGDMASLSAALAKLLVRAAASKTRIQFNEVSLRAIG